MRTHGRIAGNFFEFAKAVWCIEPELETALAVERDSDHIDLSEARRELIEASRKSGRSIVTFTAEDMGTTQH